MKFVFPSLFILYFVVLLHCPLSKKEEISRESLRDVLPLEDLVNLSKIQKIFPGRHINDLKRIFTKEDNLNESMLVALKRNVKPSIHLRIRNARKKVIPSKHDEICRHQIYPKSKPSIQLSGYHPIYTCKESSGPVTCISVNSSYCNVNGLSVMVGSCATQDQTYNRPGEVISLCFDESSIGCFVLDGHSTTVPGGSVVRSTTTNVIYDEKMDRFLSTGYDGRLCLWSGKNKTQKLASIPLLMPGDLSTNVINCLDINCVKSVAICGTGNGNLFSVNYTDVNDCRIENFKQLVKKGTKPWTNQVDMVSYSNNVLFAGVGFHTECDGGQIFQIDPTNMKIVKSFKATTGLSCMNYCREQNILAVGTGGVIDGASGLGEFYLLDCREPTWKCSIVKTGQLDMEGILFSPDGQYISVSDGLKGNIIVFDHRQTTKPLFSVETHGIFNGGLPTMLGMHWSNDGPLYTGGVDGILRIHSTASTKLLQEIDVGHHINCISASIDSSTLFVGTDFGTLNLYSLNPSLASSYSTRHSTFY